MEYWNSGKRRNNGKDEEKIENLKMMNSQKVVSPVKTGVQRISKSLKELDSGFRRNDDH